MQVFNQPVALAVPLNANSVSTAIPLKNLYLYNVTAVITGTPTGVIELQASSDPETNPSQTVPPPANWITITNSNFTLSSAGKTMWNDTDVAYNWVRVKYTDASGGMSTAVMDIIFNGKAP